MKDYSKLKVGMLIMILVVMVGLVGCDSGTGNDGSAIQDYSVDIIIEDINEDEVDDLKIYAAGETHDGLNDYQENNKVEYSITLTDSADISVAHENEDIAFTPQTQKVDSSDDNISLIFRKGKYADNIVELRNLFESGDTRAIILDGDINFDDVEEEFFELNLNREIIVDGFSNYGIKGDGSMRVFLNEHDLIFKNLSFQLGEQFDWNDNPDHTQNDYFNLVSEGGDIIFENIEATQNYEDINNFIVAFTDGKVIINDSKIDLNLNGYFIDLNSGGIAEIKNNIFAGSSDWGFIRTTNASRKAKLTIMNNDFTNVEDNLFDVSTFWDDNNVEVNEITLKPVADVENDNKVNEFEDTALEIHNNLALTNEMPDDYYTGYGYGTEEKFRHINYIGEVDLETVVEFADENLEQAVRDHINQPDGPIYKGYVDSIKYLETNIGGIESLDGLEYFESLESIFINTGENNSNKISDLSPLFDLDNLYSCMIRDNEGLTDLNQLENIDNLTRLLINHDHQIEDFSPLERLTGLTYLNLGNTGMNNQDLEYIRNLTNLEELFFWDNNITDISPVENLTNLRRLIYGVIDQNANNHNQVTDISPIANLVKLNQLYISDTGVVNIEPLTGLENLDNLIISNNSIDDFSPLENLTGLSILSIENTGLDSLTYFTDYSNLNVLNFSNNEVVDITPLNKISSWNFEPEAPQIYMINSYDADDEDNKKTIEDLKDKGIKVYHEE